MSPVGANFVGTTFQFSSGDVTFDPSIPIQEAHSRLSTIALSYGRALDVAGRSGTLLVVVPLVGGRQHGIVQGQFAEAVRRGIADVQVPDRRECLRRAHNDAPRARAIGPA